MKPKVWQKKWYIFLGIRSGLVDGDVNVIPIQIL